MVKFFQHSQTNLIQGDDYMSIADKIFINNCSEILKNGFWDRNYDVRPRWTDGQAAHTIKLFGLVNRYDLSSEFPVLTIRKTNITAAVDELLWIWQKKSNNVNDLNSKIWDSWADENGSIGKAYGFQLGIKHKYREGMFDQVDRLLYDLKNSPNSRRMITNIYNHNDLHEMNLYPCAYSVTFNVTENRLNAVLNQRSQDMLVANNWNVSQYAVLVHMLAQVSGLEVGELVHVIADAHIYDRHIPVIEEILNNEIFPAPSFVIDKSIDDFYKFKTESFELKDYNFNKLKQKIPVAV